MTTRTIAFLSVVFVVALAWASWMFRYEPMLPYGVLDRWTGEVLYENELRPVPQHQMGFTPLVR